MAKFSLAGIATYLVLGAVAPGMSFSVPVAEAATSSELHPHSNGNANLWLPNDLITKSSAVSTDDGDSTFIWSGGNNNGQTFTVDNAGIPNDATVNSVAVYAVAKKYALVGNPTVKMKFLVENGSSSEEVGSDISLSSSYTEYSHTMSVNPLTTSAWTAGEVNSWSTNFGVVRTNASAFVRVTEVYVVIDYTAASSSSSSSSSVVSSSSSSSSSVSSGSSSSSNGCLNPGDSIQDAITAATDGDTICLNPGLYQQNSTITVNKEVTITRASCDPDAIITRTPGDTATEAIVDGGNSSNIFKIEASNVTLQCLEVRNGSADLIYNTTSTRTGLVIKNNIVHDSSGDEGIQLKKAPGALVQYNDVYDTYGDGINLSDGSDDGQILDNRVHDNNSDNAAIYVYDSTGITVSGNLVYDVNGNDGIKIGNKGGGDATADGGDVTNNVIVDTVQDGISIYMSNLTVSGNKIKDSGTVNGAIYVPFGGSSNVDITDNLIIENTRGVKIGGSGTPTDVTVNDNCIEGNTDGLTFNGTTPNLDATSNWWGAADGPSGSGPGAGDSVSANVDFSSFGTTGCALPAINDANTDDIPDGDDDPLDPTPSVLPDTTAPVIEILGFRDQANGTYNDAMPIRACGSINTTGAVAFEWQEVGTDASQPLTYLYEIIGGPHTGYSAPHSDTHHNGVIPSEGVHTIQVTATDDAGNVSAPVECVVTYDADYVAPVACVATDDELVAYWKLDEEQASSTATDSAGGNDGTYVGSTEENSDVAPLAFANPAARHFDGSEYVNAGDILDFTTTFTVSAWVNPDSLGTDRQIVSRGYDGTDTQWEMKTSSVDGKVTFRSWQSAAVGVETTAGVLTAGEWTHVAGTFDGTNWKIYVDGVLNNSVAGAAPTSVDRNVVIGAVDTPTGYRQNWEGFIDDVRVYDSVLTDDQVAEIYASACNLDPDPTDSNQLTLSGHKFNNKNGDRDQDGGEENLASWEFRLYKENGANWDLVDTDVADGSGTYKFAQQYEAGTYHVCEVAQNGWQQVKQDWSGTPYHIVTDNISPSAFEEGEWCSTTVYTDEADRSSKKYFGNMQAGPVVMQMGYETQETLDDDSDGNPAFGFCPVTTADQTDNGNQSSNQVLKWTKVTGATQYRITGYRLDGINWVPYGSPSTKTLAQLSISGSVVTYDAYATAEVTTAYFIEALSSTDDVLGSTTPESTGFTCTFTVDRTPSSSSSSSSSDSSSSSSDSSSSSSSSTGSGSSSSSSAPVIQTLGFTTPESDGNSGARRGQQTNALGGAVNYLTGIFFGTGNSGSPFGSSVAPGAFGGGPNVPLTDDEIAMICSMRKALPVNASPSIMEWLAGYLAPLIDREMETILEALQNPALCAPVEARAAVTVGSKAFKVNEAGYPVSKNPTWNACITGRVTLEQIRNNPDKDEDGIGRSCSNYHTKDVWKHPDSGIYFTFNRETMEITLPEGYVVRQDQRVSQN